MQLCFSDAIFHGKYTAKLKTWLGPPFQFVTAIQWQNSVASYKHTSKTNPHFHWMISFFRCALTVAANFCDVITAGAEVVAGDVTVAAWGSLAVSLSTAPIETSCSTALIGGTSLYFILVSLDNPSCMSTPTPTSPFPWGWRGKHNTWSQPLLTAQKHEYSSPYQKTSDCIKINTESGLLWACFLSSTCIFYCAEMMSSDWTAH